MLSLPLVGIGCKDLKIPNGVNCVGIVKGGYCKATVTHEEELISRQRMIDLIWKEGAVVIPAPLYAEYLKVFEKICNRQNSCEIKDVGRSLKAMQELNKINMRTEEETQPKEIKNENISNDNADDDTIDHIRTGRD